MRKKTAVAILILLELTLQSSLTLFNMNSFIGRNPYFIGINSAIKGEKYNLSCLDASQSLFYWN